MTSQPPPMAAPRVAAGALFFDERDRVLIVRPTYKRGWDIPGGYVEPGESPAAACRREVREELGIEPPLGRLLVVDWAPTDSEGDKMLFLFDGHVLDADHRREIQLQSNELSEWTFVSEGDMASKLIPRLARRLTQAISARRNKVGVSYLEHGAPLLTPAATDWRTVINRTH